MCTSPQGAESERSAGRAWLIRLCAADSGWPLGAWEAEVEGQAFGSTREEQSGKWRGGTGDFSKGSFWGCWIPIRALVMLDWSDLGRSQGSQPESDHVVAHGPVSQKACEPEGLGSAAKCWGWGWRGEVQGCLGFLICGRSTKFPRSRPKSRGSADYIPSFIF